MSYRYNKRQGPARPAKNDRRSLEYGIKGFIATCNFREKDCAREACEILKTYAAKLTEKTGHINLPDEPDVSLPAEDNSEISNDTRTQKCTPYQYHRFRVVNSGAQNCVFIESTVPEPAKLVHMIMKDAKLKKEALTKFVVRLLPVEVTCRADTEAIKVAADEMFERHFTGEPTSFAIFVNKRCNNSLNREEVTSVLADLVCSKNTAHKVDLKQPEKAVLVEAIRGVCCLSVVRDYFELRKYNLAELAPPESPTEKGAGEPTQEISEKVPELVNAGADETTDAGISVRKIKDTDSLDKDEGANVCEPDKTSEQNSAGNQLKTEDCDFIVKPQQEV